MKKSEGASGSDLRNILAVGEVHTEGFFADERVREVDGVFDGIGVRWIDRDEFGAFPNFQFPANSQLGSSPAVLAYAGFTDEFHERVGDVVQDRQVQLVAVTGGGGDAAADVRREKGFGGGGR